MLRTSTLPCFVLLLVTSACAAPNYAPIDPNDEGFWQKSKHNSQQGFMTPEHARIPEKTVDQLIAKAKLERKGRDLVSAAITAHQAINKEEWHFEANELLQDIQLERNQFESLHDVYLAKLKKDYNNGIALYLFMRPILKNNKRAKLVTTKMSPEDSQKTGELFNLILEGDASFEQAEPILEKLFSIAPLHISGHRVYQDLYLNAQKADTDYDTRIESLLKRYNKIKRDNEVNGDAVYLYERVASLKSPREQSLIDSTLRFAMSWELPGYWHFYGFAAFCHERADKTKEGDERTALVKLANLLYTTCIATDELNYEGYFGRGITFQELGQFDQAITDYKDGIAVSGANVDFKLYLRLGQAYIAANQIELAVKTYEEGRARYPELLSFPLRIAKAEEMRKRYRDASNAYEEVLKMLPPEDESVKALALKIKNLRKIADEAQ